MNNIDSALAKRVYVMCMTDDAVLSINKNPASFQKKIAEYPDSSDWINQEFKGKAFDQKKFLIPDFTLKTSPDGDYSKVDFDNSVTLWGCLKQLPPFILYNEGFWLWILFTKGYQAAQQAMPMTEKQTVALHWTFSAGNRRGLFFGVLSRCYLRVAMTVDESLPDKFLYTRWVIENPERFRNLTWRSNSNLSTIVHGAIRAEYDYYQSHKDAVSSKVYKLIAKDISDYGSVRLLDSLSEEDVYNFVSSRLPIRNLELVGAKND